MTNEIIKTLAISYVDLENKILINANQDGRNRQIKRHQNCIIAKMIDIIHGDNEQAVGEECYNLCKELHDKIKNLEVMSVENIVSLVG